MKLSNIGMMILILIAAVGVNVMGSTGSKIPEDYDQEAFRTIMNSVEKRLGDLESRESSVIVSKNQPKGANGKFWFNPNAEKFYVFVGNEWKEVSFK